MKKSTTNLTESNFINNVLDTVFLPGSAIKQCINLLCLLILILPGQYLKAQYCTAGASNTSFSKISNVTFNTINNNSSSTAGYENFTAVSTTAEKENTYLLSISVSSNSTGDQVFAWIDYNADLDFADAGEQVYTSAVGLGPYNILITIPSTATLGATRMRIRLDGPFTTHNNTPCGNSAYGQVEDYTLNIATCVSSLPVPGNTQSSIAPPICIGSGAQSFSLSMSNTPTNTSFQWQSSPDNVTWTNISGATNLTHAVSSINAMTWFRCQTTNCAGTVASTPLQMTTVGCFCTAGATQTTAEKISNVQFHTINNSSSGTVGYEDFTAVTTTVEKGGTYEFSAQLNLSFSDDEVIVWIDYNQDSDFTDPGEEVYHSAIGSGPFMGNVLIPASATNGNTRMRIRLLDQYDVSDNRTPCGNSSYGQVEDYTINIANCTSPAPVPGNTLSSAVPPICYGGQVQGFTLSLSNTLTGVTYQWQSSPDNSTWSNISGANVSTYTEDTLTATTWFRCQVSNCAGNVVNSTPFQMTVQGCWCTANTNFIPGEKISNITFNAINNNSSGTSGYENFTNISTTVEKGNIYAFSGIQSGTNSSYKMIVFIDYNIDYDFDDPGEEVFNSATFAGPYTTNVLVPASAATGTTRMRVKLLQAGLSGNASNPAPCGNHNYGQIEDYAIQLIPCSGVPVPGNTQSTVSPPVCYGSGAQSFILSFANSLSGALYQWQSSPDNSTWSDISGATAATHTVSSISTVTWYRCSVTTCGGTVYSNPLQMTVQACYCAAGATNSGTNGKISNILFNTINNTSSGTGGYEDFTGVTTTLEKGNTYQLTNTFVTGGSSLYETIVWIDLNADLDFADAGEEVLNTATGLSPHAGSFLVPNTATSGNTRMRVRLNWTGSGSNITPCGNSQDGQVEDYTVNIIPCAGLPVPGNTQTSAQPVCIGSGAQSFTLSIANTLNGVSYQWQSSPNNSTWTDISGATGATTVISSISAVTWYRCRVTNCGGTDYSVALQQTVQGCFCAASGPVSPGGSNPAISNVTFHTINNNSSSTTTYEDFTGISATVEKGNTYPFTGTINNTTNGDEIIVWIDFNGDFDFADAGEEVFNSSIGQGPFSGNILIPGTASTGITRMRVRTHYPGAGGANSTPCGTSSFGQVEDYLLNITPCASGLPVPGNTQSSVAPPVCISSGAQSFVLSMSNTVTGATYQWQSSPDNTTWTNVAGATSATTTIASISAVTWFRCQVITCAGTAYSVPLQMTTVGCYCAANAFSNSLGTISNVTFNTINNPSTGTGGYENFLGISTDLQRTNSYELTCTFNTANFNFEAVVWIDYNQDFDFADAGEEVFNSATGLGPHTGNILIPAGAVLGNTRMRVRMNFAVQSMGSCGEGPYGQVEDYTVNIVACSTPPNPGNTVTSVASPVCSGSQGFTLSLQNSVTSATYQWQSSPDNSNWSNVSGATNATYAVANISAATWYRCQVTRCGNLTVSSTPLQMNIQVCYCPAGATSTSYEKISNVMFNTINKTSSGTAGYEDFTATSTSIQMGSSYTVSCTISNAYTSDEVIVWIDYNQDKDFTDPGEEVFNSPTGVGPFSGAIAIPCTAMNGNTRMRVRLHDATANGSNTTSCGNSSYGQVEDYTVNILLPPNIYYPDNDNDGYGAGAGTAACTQPANTSTNDDDCDDFANAVNPGATEVCNTIDDNCNGSIDEGVQNTYYADADFDTYGDPATSIMACTAPIGYVTDNTDCDDTPGTGINVNPGATEVCNGIDDDCEGGIDEGVQTTYYADADGDNYGDPGSTTMACTAPIGYVTDNTDCDDTPGTGTGINPGATEICNGGIDDDCDLLADDADPSVTGQSPWYQDIDGDGLGNPAAIQNACTMPFGFVSNSLDCNDNSTVSSCNTPTNPLVSGLTDVAVTLSWNAVVGAERYNLDFKLASDPTYPPAIKVYTNSYSFTGLLPGTKYNWRVRANCDTLCSLNSANLPGGSFRTNYRGYPDADADGFGDATQPYVLLANFPTPGYSLNNTDCNDANNAIRPNATEICNMVDDDCDMAIDEGITTTTWYQDADGDGLGNAAVSQLACMPPFGYVTNALDCNDLSNVAVCSVPTGVSAEMISQFIATLVWQTSPCVSFYQIRYRKSTDLSWINVSPINGGNYPLSGLTPGTLYLYQVRSRCTATTPATASAWVNRSFTTISLPMGFAAEDSGQDNAPDTYDNDLYVYPNPGDGIFNIRTESLSETEVTMILTDELGKIVLKNTWSLFEGQNSYQLDLINLASGVYQVQILQGDLMLTKKIVLMK